MTNPDLAYHRRATLLPCFSQGRLLTATALTGVLYVPMAGFVLLLVNAAGDQLAPPLPNVLTFASVAVMLPAVLASRWALLGRAGLGALHSITGRFRWRWAAQMTAVAAAVVAVELVVLRVFLADHLPQPGPTLPFGRVVLTLTLIVAIVPVQAAAEEYAFRGMLMQQIGAWSRSPLVAVVTTSVLFTAGHRYDACGLVAVMAFGLAAAFVTVRTGGLEAAVAIHVVNNGLLLSLQAFGILGNSSASDAADMVTMVADVLMVVSFAAIVEWQLRRTGLMSQRPNLDH